MQWINHRGIHTRGLCPEPEGSFASFKYAVDQGWGIEFDLQMTVDHHFVVNHDPVFSTDKGPVDISRSSLNEIRKHDPEGSQVPGFRQILELIQTSPPHITHALHWKGSYQTSSVIKELHNQYSDFKKSLQRCLIFDLTIATAEKLKHLDENLILCPSVSHPYDIARYAKVTYQTLLTKEQVASTQGIWSWVWLDEWDLSGQNGQRKKLIQPETCDWARAHNFSIAVVSPELHSTSSSLLGGESHPDGAPPRLWERIEEIQKLQIDAICSDYCCYYNREINPSPSPSPTHEREIHA